MKILIVKGCMACACPQYRILKHEPSGSVYSYCYLADRIIHRGKSREFPDFCPLRNFDPMMWAQELHDHALECDKSISEEFEKELQAIIKEAEK